MTIIIYFLYLLESKLKVLTKKYLYSNNRYTLLYKKYLNI